MLEHLQALLMQWAQLGPPVADDTIAPTFTFEAHGEFTDREEFLDRRIYGGYTELTIRDSVEAIWDDVSTVAIMFDFIDSVTLLHHRGAWMARYGRGQLQSIVAAIRAGTGSYVPPRG